MPKKKKLIKSKKNLEKNRDTAPILKYVFEKNKKSGEKNLKSIELSDGTKAGDSDYSEKTKAALKRTTGSKEASIALEIIQQISWGMSSNDREDRTRLTTKFLPALRPQDETEALLLGQFLALQNSGMARMRDANYNEMFYHVEKNFQLAVKLLRCANETMQTLLKYRSGGKQQIQVVHISGGQAIVANEVSSGGGNEKKS